MCDIGLHKSHEFILALEKAGFTDDLFQEVISSRGNKKAKAMYAAVTDGNQADDRFELLNTFEVVVPEGYDHSTRLTTFKAAHQSEENKEFYYYNEAITDANFAKATTKLAPGRKFTVKVFGINGRVTSNDCLLHLKRVSATLVGAQGISIVYEQAKNELPKGKWSVSFDEKDALPFLGGCRRVPYVYRYSDGDFRLNLGHFEDDWDDEYCLLAFCD